MFVDTLNPVVPIYELQKKTRKETTANRIDSDPLTLPVMTWEASPSFGDQQFAGMMAEQEVDEEARNRENLKRIGLCPPPIL